MKRLLTVILGCLAVIFLSSDAQNDKRKIFTKQIASIIGRKGQPLIDAQDAEPGEFPWMVALTYVDGKFFCGGSLIHPKWILTAGHCLFDKYGKRKLPNAVRARMGSRNRLSQSATVVQPLRLHVHVDYDFYGRESPDVGLVELSEPVEGINPVCLYFHLPGQSQLPPLTDWDAVVMGWGHMGQGCPPQPEDLKKLYVDIVPVSHCTGPIQHHLCAGRRWYEAAWVCHGDSGSPMLGFLPTGMDDYIHNTSLLETWDMHRPCVQVGVASGLAWAANR